ncbi:unnamed protein product, partial [Effrenium voratum]
SADLAQGLEVSGAERKRPMTLRLAQDAEDFQVFAKEPMYIQPVAVYPCQGLQSFDLRVPEALSEGLCQGEPALGLAPAGLAPKLDVRDGQGMPNPGSLGHPEVCKRPCVYWTVSSCSNGKECGYCHMPHTQRPAHLDKRQRELVQTLGTRELFFVLLKHLRAKARDKGFLRQADELLQLIQTVAKEPDSLPSVPQKVLTKLDALLSKMTFAALVGLALRRKDVDEQFVEDAGQALTRLRTLLTP